jgi:hypothetical protein
MRTGRTAVRGSASEPTATNRQLTTRRRQGGRHADVMAVSRVRAPVERRLTVLNPWRCGLPQPKCCCRTLFVPQCVDGVDPAPAQRRQPYGKDGNADQD